MTSRDTKGIYGSLTGKGRWEIDWSCDRWRHGT